MGKLAKPGSWALAVGGVGMGWDGKHRGDTIPTWVDTLFVDTL